MKKMITLLLSFGLFATAFAQNNRQQNNSRYNRDDQYATTSNGKFDSRNDRKFYDDRSVSFARERDATIARINRDYNFKVMSIQSNRYMKNRQKKLAIRDVEFERARQLQMVNENYKSQLQNGYGRYDNGRR